MKKDSLRGISRIHSKGAGWLVRLYRNTRVITKLFSDGVYGGPDKSLLAAKAYYRQAQIDFPVQEKPPFRETPLRNNTSGYNGICETFSRTRKGEKIPCWNVSWYNPPNQLRSKKFHFHDAQERKQALKEALQFRKEREAEILKRARQKRRITA